MAAETRSVEECTHVIGIYSSFTSFPVPLLML